MKKFFKSFFYPLPAIIVGVLAVATIVSAFVDPSGPPPTNNTDTPINVGSAEQTKTGNLILQNRTLYGDDVILGGDVVRGITAAGDLTLKNASGITTITLLGTTGSLDATTITQNGTQVSLVSHNHSGVYEPVVGIGTTSQYWRGDKSWQTLQSWATTPAATADLPWSKLTSFPVSATCSTGQYVKTIGSTITCDTPIFGTLTVADIPDLPATKITSGTFGVARGGTGLSTLTTGGILYISATDTFSRIAPTAANQVLRSTGANALTIGSLVAGDIPNLDAGKITTGKFPIAQGGTNATTFTSDELIKANTSGTALESSGKKISDFLSTTNDFGRSGAAADLYEGIVKLSAKYLGIADNATTATKLQTARSIFGISFDGTANIGSALGTGAYATIADYAPLNSPTFTGTVSGITATMVGLGNVTNESKTTMFTSPIFTGNVGIGTTPSEKLTIQGSSAGRAVINLNQIGADNWVGLKIDRDSFEKWFMGADDANKYVVRRNYTANDLVIDTSGNITIAQNLIVGGATTFGGIAYTWPSVNGTEGQALTTTSSGLAWTTVAGALPSGSSGKILKYGTSGWAASDEIFIDTAGNVGIGTMGPNEKLEIVANGNIRLNNNVGNSAIGWGGTTSTAAPNPLIYSDGSYLALNSKAGSRLYFNYDNSDSGSDVDFFNGKVVIKQSGNISWTGSLTGGTVPWAQVTGDVPWGRISEKPVFSTLESDPVVKAITGIVKSNGITISSAVAGTDYVATEIDPNVKTWAKSADTIADLPWSKLTNVPDLDPKIGTFGINGKWCTTDGSKVNCTSDTPPEVDTLQDVTNRTGGATTNKIITTAGLTLNGNAPTVIEGDISAIGNLIGYDDLFLKGNASETATIYYGADIHRFFTAGTERLVIANNGQIRVSGQIKIEGGRGNEPDITNYVLTSTDNTGLAEWRSGLSGAGTANSLARWKADGTLEGSGIYQNTVGQVGIAGAKLEIKDTGTSAGLLDVLTLYNARGYAPGENNGPAILFKGPQGNIFGRIGAVSRDYNSTQGIMSFQVVNGVQDTPEEIIKIETGNVSIAHDLNVSGNINGTFTGTTPASNVTAGTFATGNFAFPASLNVDTDTLFVDSANNRVGIGTPGPDTPLHISTSAVTGLRITSSAVPRIDLYSTNADTGTRNWAFRPDWAVFGDLAIMQSNARLGDPVDAGTARLYIKNDGKVGIGTTNPSKELEVEGSIKFTGKLFDSNGEFSGSKWTGTTDVYRKAGKVGIGTVSPAGKLHTEDTLYNQTSCAGGYVPGDYDGDTSSDDCRAVGIVALANGNVGIGTAEPRKELEIGGNVFITGEGYSAPISGSGLQVGYNTGPGEGFLEVADYTVPSAPSFKNLVLVGNDIDLRANAKNDAFIIKSSGKVGIGTTGPSARLQVSGGQTWGSDIKLEAGGTGGSTWSLISTNQSATEGAGKFLIKDNAGLGTDRMTIDTNGNVGIGTTSPGTKLEVLGNVLLGEYANGGEDIYPSTWTSLGPGDNDLCDGDNVGEYTNKCQPDITKSCTDIRNSNEKRTVTCVAKRLLATSINATDNSGRLEVAGQIKITGGNPGATKVLTSDADGLASWQSSGSTQWGFNDTDKYLYTTTTETKVKVGIGTTTPGAGLDVKNTIDTSNGVATGVNFAQTLTAKADNDVLTALRIAPTFTGSFAGVKQYGLIVESGNVGIGTTGPSIQLALGDSDTGFQQAGDGILTFLTNNFERMRINETGNVGIGTSTPEAELTVMGNLNKSFGAVTVTAGGTGKPSTVNATNIGNGTYRVGDTIKLVGTTTEVVTVATIVGVNDITIDPGVHGGGYTAYYDPDFFQIANGVGTSKFTIDKSGNVGIGTTAPDANLHIHNSAGGAELKISNMSGKGATLGSWTSSNAFNMNPLAESGEFYFGRDVSLSKFIIQSGNVGIVSGTAYGIDDTYKLTIDKGTTTNIAGIKVIASVPLAGIGTGGATKAAVFIQNTNDGYGLQIDKNGGAIKAGGGLIIETRTTDVTGVSLEDGRIWLCTDAGTPCDGQ